MPLGRRPKHNNLYLHIERLKIMKVSQLFVVVDVKSTYHKYLCTYVDKIFIITVEVFY